MLARHHHGRSTEPVLREYTRDICAVIQPDDHQIFAIRLADIRCGHAERNPADRQQGFGTRNSKVDRHDETLGARKKRQVPDSCG